MFGSFKQTRLFSELDQCIEYAREAVSCCPQESPAWAASLDILSQSLISRYEELGDLTNVQEFVSLHRKALLPRPHGHPDRYHSLLSLAKASHTHFCHTGESQELTDAIEFGCLALSLFDSASHDQPTFFTTVAALMLSSFKQTYLSPELDQCIEYAQEAVLCCPPESPARAASLDILSRSLLSRYEEQGEPADLEVAIEYAQEATFLCHTGRLDRSRTRVTLAAGLLARFERARKPEDLVQSVFLCGDIYELCLSPAPLLLALYSTFVPASFTLFRYLEEQLILEASISMGSEALALCPPGHPNRPHSLINLAYAKYIRFIYAKPQGSSKSDDAVVSPRETVESLPPETAVRAEEPRTEFFGRREDIDDVIASLHEAVELLPSGVTVRAVALSRLADALFIRFGMLPEDSLDDLEECVARHKEALSAYGPCAPECAEILDRLSLSLNVRFMVVARDEQEDLSKAIDYGEEALALCRPGRPRRGHISSLLSDVLYRRFCTNSNMEDLDRSIAYSRETLQMAPDLVDSITLSNSKSALARTLMFRFSLTGQLDDISDSIRYSYDTLSLYPRGHSRRPGALVDLSFRFATRFVETKQLGDVDSGISCLREALSLLAPESPERLEVLEHLKAHLYVRYGETKDPQEMEECARYAEEAHALRLYSPTSVTVESTVGFRLQHELTGESEWLDKAVDHFRGAISDWSSMGQPYLHPGISLCYAVFNRYEAFGRLEDLDECIDLARRVLSSYPPGMNHLGRRIPLLALYKALLRRYLDTGSETDISDAIFYARESAVSQSGSGRLERLEVAIEWTTMAHLENHPSTLEAYRTGLELLEQYLTCIPTLELQHEAVREAKSLSSNAAAYAIGQGDLKLAVEMLEQGRALLWSQVRRLRTPLDQLAADEGSVHLRDAFLEKSRALETLNTSASPFVGGSAIEESRDPYRRMLETKERLTAELNGVIEQIRIKLPDFLKLPSYDKLKAVSAEGPVIIVNRSIFRSDAIILGPGDNISNIQLSDTFYKQSIELSNKLLQARQILKYSAQKEYDRVLRLTLKTLGNLLVDPVVGMLKELGVEEGSRIWWCPTSVVSALPLHAAGPLTMPGPRSSKTKVYLPDLYIPSYTPTLTALIEARTAPAGGYRPVEHAGILGVALLDESLQAVADEVEVLRTRFTEDKLTLAIGSGCNRDAVVAGLAERPWVHFACHGTLKASEPFDSALILSGDERLTLLDIVKVGLHNAELAVLSACHTAEQTQGSAMDEALHLAAAMQFSGFRSVVGTVWQMRDEDGPTLAEYFYRALFEERGDEDIPHASEVGFKKAARALCSATKEMRRRKVSLERWVNFVHIGA
ncbi:uncharacterized protein PHACADRAFT_189751 [Phanerochaete carnosa HHB-10118-sp]|uniref:CHAT domain-containing protein n=1 Tax=Phanerochaete carnosa (strain HHB-10118-sp) TaxID=650164 RepID=K5WMF1_PHACS|nr:uncharacterized protein PHACADRAFT_189751 [Phanerochaete carnosa HHB-10118-sp]EKM60625.1 hypothetical protein PHACADRAFT_189751 [Phanerochaete carnosa HHB-10118-sp]